MLTLNAPKKNLLHGLLGLPGILILGARTFAPVLRDVMVIAITGKAPQPWPHPQAACAVDEIQNAGPQEEGPVISDAELAPENLPRDKQSGENPALEAPWGAGSYEAPKAPPLKAVPLTPPPVMGYIDYLLGKPRA
ncbi:MAG: hypothetical protein AB7G80_08490 [Dongiaceae bacterium]